MKNKGIEIAKFIKNISPDNMYILCKSKISEVGELINSNGALYLDFESALPYYEKNGILAGNDPETTEFNDIMNFLYMGRKEKNKEISANTRFAKPRIRLSEIYKEISINKKFSRL